MTVKKPHFGGGLFVQIHLSQFVHWGYNLSQFVYAAIFCSSVVRDYVENVGD